MRGRWLVYFQAIWLHWICLGIVIAMVWLGSVVFTAPSSNATISFIVVVGILFAGGHLNGIAIEMHGFRGALVYAIYYLIPHLEWFDVRDWIIHDWGADRVAGLGRGDRLWRRSTAPCSWPAPGWSSAAR